MYFQALHGIDFFGIVHTIKEKTMFKHRVARNRFLYIILLGLIITGFGYLMINYQLKMYQMVLMATIILIPNRLARYYWFDFFAGKRELRRKRPEQATIRFRQFLETLRGAPWVKWLMFFSYGLYSFKVEAVALVYLGHAWLYLKKYDDAEKAFRDALLVDDKYVMAKRGLAAVYILRGQKNEAQKWLDLACRFGHPKISFDKFEELTRKEYNA